MQGFAHLQPARLLQGGFLVDGVQGATGIGHVCTRQASIRTALQDARFQRGALFYTGDAHAVQGDGEVNGTAVETSLSPVLQFVVHKGKGATMKWPRGEDANNYYVMGMDVDLNVAMSEAVQESVVFLQQQRGLAPGDAYALASVATNFGISQTVNHVRTIYGEIPKRIFATNPPFWAQQR